MQKTILGHHGAEHGHWVGDGFPVRSLFSYHRLQQQISPFLLLDYGGPHYFEPSTERSGVGQHPHRGFETVTIVYDGEIAHRDSAGNGGIIGPGNVQWMTAGGGILHEEYHGPGFARTGGPLRLVQLWVNLPARDKMTPANYQGIVAHDIPVVTLPNGSGTARVIAGELSGVRGPAKTFTPVNVWDMRLDADAQLDLDLPEGHTSMLVVLSGHITVGGVQEIGTAEMVLLSREGSTVPIAADGDATVLVLTGAPLHEPIVGSGPFVMNTEAEIVQAYQDFTKGRSVFAA